MKNNVGILNIFINCIFWIGLIGLCIYMGCRQPRYCVDINSNENMLFFNNPIDVPQSDLILSLQKSEGPFQFDRDYNFYRWYVFFEDKIGNCELKYTEDGKLEKIVIWWNNTTKKDYYDMLTALRMYYPTIKEYGTWTYTSSIKQAMYRTTSAHIKLGYYRDGRILLKLDNTKNL